MPSLDQFGAAKEAGVSSEEEMPEASGVSSEEEMAETAQPDEAQEWQAELAKLREENARLAQLREQDVSKLRSTYDSKLAAQEAQARELSNKLRELETRDMDEDQLLRYERDELQRAVQQRDEELARVHQEVQQSRNLASIIDAFTAFGIPVSELEISSGDARKITENGYNAIYRKMQAQNARIEELESGQAKPQPAQQKAAGDPTAQVAEEEKAPSVLPNVQGDVSSGRTWGELLAALKQNTGKTWTEEDVYRAVEAETLPSSVIPGFSSQ